MVGWRKDNKFSAVKVQLDGHLFDSKAESRRYCDLKNLERAGHISRLVVHPKYVFVIQDLGDEPFFLGNFTPDFSYIEDGLTVVEDVKSPPTRKLEAYRLRKKLLKALYGIDLQEV